MKRFVAVLLTAVVLAGCDKRNSAVKNSSGGSASNSAGSTAEFVVPELVPFDKIALASDSSYEIAPIADGTLPGEVREFTKLKIKFCWCPPGEFRMGSPEDAPDHQLNETQFGVTFSKGFWIQQTELTQSQYEELMGSNPSFFRGPQNPVESLTWPEATEFCRRMSELPPEKNAGNLYRLPSEAEWEYACRAGSTTVFCHGDHDAGLEDYAWYENNSERTTHPVGKKKSNAWGIHDMHGNVSEWCEDYYGEYPRTAVTDPRGPSSGDKRTLRGGGWFFVPIWARSSHRDAYIPSARYVGLGFRLVATGTSRESTQNSDERSTIP